MIQPGALLPVLMSKKAPRQVLLLSCPIWKSSLLIAQCLLPNESDTFTVVLQAGHERVS